MAYGEHETTVALCRVNWDDTYSDVAKFSSKTEQLTYFSSLPSWYEISGDDFRFIDGAVTRATIRVPMRPEGVQHFNYLVYNNRDDASLKFGRVYCFIDNVKAINYEVSEIEMTVDVMQTYQFSYNLLDSHIVQETVVEDDMGFDCSFFENPNTLMEIDTSHKVINTTGCFYYIAFSSLYVRFNDGGVWTQYFKENGGSKVGTTDIPYGFAICSSMEEVRKIINEHQKHSTGDVEPVYNMNDIVGVGLISKFLASQPHTIWSSGFNDNITCQILGLSGTTFTYQSQCDQYATHEKVFTRPSKLNNGTYTPNSYAINFYPFHYPRLNSGGRTMDLRWECSNNRTSITLGFDYYFTDTWHCVVYPKNYNKYGAYSPDVNKFFDFPIATLSPYESSTYMEYMASTRVQREQASRENIGSLVLGGIETAIGVVATANGGGTFGTPLMIGGVSSLTSGLAGQNKLKETNDLMKKGNGKEVNGDFGSDILLLQMDIPLYFENVQIKLDKLIEYDHSLQAFGYPFNIYGRMANLTGKAWHYIRTENATISNSGMTNHIKKQIQNIYDSGVRFWYEPNHLRDFTYYNWKNNIPDTMKEGEKVEQT